MKTVLTELFMVIAIILFSLSSTISFISLNSSQGYILLIGDYNRIVSRVIYSQASANTGLILCQNAVYPDKDYVCDEAERRVSEFKIISNESQTQVNETFNDLKELADYNHILDSISILFLSLGTISLIIYFLLFAILKEQNKNMLPNKV